MSYGWVALAIASSACATGSAAVTNAVVNTAIAAVAAGANRAAGGCYSTCPPGTACDVRTGLCEELPCRGKCLGNEVCEQPPNQPPRCVSRSQAFELPAASNDVPRL